MTNRLTSGILFGLVLMGVCGVVSAQAPTALKAFVDGDVKLEPHPDLKKVYRHIAPEKDLKAYGRVMLEPLEIWLHEDSPYKGFKADDMKALSDRFLEVMIDELEPDYPVVSRPGPGVAVARIAISGIKLKKKKRGLLGYTPIGFVATTAMDAAGKRISLVDGTIEAEVLDGVSGERVAVLVDFSFKEGKGSQSWGDLEARLRFYAQRFREQLDRAHGREVKPSADAEPDWMTNS